MASLILRKCRPEMLRRLPGVLSLCKRSLPVCSVETNLQPKQVPSDFTTGFAKVIADTLSKPIKIITVSIQTDVNMSRDGNADPTASVHIWSVGVFDAERNKGYSKPFIDYLSDQLNIPTERVTVMLHPINKETAAHLLYAEMKK